MGVDISLRGVRAASRMGSRWHLDFKSKNLSVVTVFIHRCNAVADAIASPSLVSDPRQFQFELAMYKHETDGQLSAEKVYARNVLILCFCCGITVFASSLSELLPFCDMNRNKLANSVFRPCRGLLPWSYTKLKEVLSNVSGIVVTLPVLQLCFCLSAMGWILSFATTNMESPSSRQTFTACILLTWMAGPCFIIQELCRVQRPYQPSAMLPLQPTRACAERSRDCKLEGHKVQPSARFWLGESGHG